MKNQYLVCTHERTMKAQTGTILVCFAIVAFKSLVAGVEVSSKVDLDSDENEDTLSNTAFDAIDSNKSAYTSESIASVSKQPVAGWRRQSELVKSREMRKRRISSADNSSSQPKVINNIQILLNSNDTLPNIGSCKHGVCDVSVSSKPDGKGNIVTEVRLSIIVKAKPNVQVNDVPVITSFRGVNKDSNERPIFHPTNAPNLLHSQLRRDYNPQIQSNYQGYSEPWYQHRQSFQRPPMYWSYQNVRDRDVLRGRKIWSQERAIVDDKIEPPLSKTKSSKETNS